MDRPGLLSEHLRLHGDGLEPGIPAAGEFAVELLR